MNIFPIFLVFLQYFCQKFQKSKNVCIFSKNYPKMLLDPSNKSCEVALFKKTCYLQYPGRKDKVGWKIGNFLKMWKNRIFATAPKLKIIDFCEHFPISITKIHILSYLCIKWLTYLNVLFIFVFLAVYIGFCYYFATNLDELFIIFSIFMLWS